MGNKKSKVINQNEPYVVRETIKPVNYEHLSIKELRSLKSIAEKNEKADSEGHIRAMGRSQGRSKSKLWRRYVRRKRQKRSPRFFLRASL
jgi:hypothetical protein